MSRPRVLLFPVLLWALLASALGAERARALTVSADFYGGYDFSRYRTYAWRQGTAARDHRVEQHIRSAIDAQMAAKGYVKVDGEADFYVATHAGRDPVFFIGLMRLAVYDAHSGKLAFGAQASDATPETLKKAKKVIDKAVRKMFKKFPKREP